MIICAQEIQSRWPESSTLRMDMLIELERRGLLTSKMIVHHNKLERVWDKV